MTAIDPSKTLARIERWTTALQERGQIEDAAGAQLKEILAASGGERLDEKDDSLLVIMLCGPTAVGKSSLINVLAGADISRRGIGATTRAAVLYVHEKDDPARLYAYSHALGSEQQETEMVRHRCDDLLHKVLVDSPDIDSVMFEHKELTARLVHAADLVLFVTSPEKYKVMRSARWVLGQRQQRGMAFVLNKWDREALGLQYDRRAELEADFRQVLAQQGFPDAVVFKVSALNEPGDRENDLPALRAWLETGISQSTGAAIRQRRQRAAWGRLATAIEAVLPEPLSNHPFLPEIMERLAASGVSAEQSVAVEAAMLEPAGLDDSAWPETPGLLGMWTRTRRRVGATTSALRSGVSFLRLPAPQSSALDDFRRDRFGRASTAMLSDAAKDLLREAALARLGLGPVGVAWSAETARLDRQLALLPLAVETEVMTEANRRRLRRVLGLASVYLVEMLIVGVLLTAAVRVGIDFVTGSYAPASAFITAMELVVILVLIGHITASLFFPPLQKRLRRRVAQRGKTLVRASVERAQTDLREHVEAIDRLAREGRDLLQAIDRTMIALVKDRGDGAGVDRLFGQEEPQGLAEVMAVPAAAPLVPASAEPTRRRPRFD
jgi:energy-coupling factor transporter ATP-binding protein EcfA2